MKVTLKGYIKVAEADISAIQKELPKHIELTRQESGCLSFQVSQDPENPNIFFVQEEFIDKVAFEKHQERVKNSHWGKVAKNVERHYQISGINIHD